MLILLYGHLRPVVNNGLALCISIDGASAASQKIMSLTLKEPKDHLQEGLDCPRHGKYDLGVWVFDLKLGDRVLLNNLSSHWKHKLSDQCSSQPFIVCAQFLSLPTYQVCPQGKIGPLKTWHSNHLLPLSKTMQDLTQLHLIWWTLVIWSQQPPPRRKIKTAGRKR